MKNLLIISTILLATSFLCNAQSDDYHWLIQNNLGKSSYTGTNNIFSNPIGFKFILDGVSLPTENPSIDPGNDLFIVFADGNHFNSRGLGLTDRFFTEGPESILTTHNFSNNYTSAIQYMYLSDIYEEDDPPDAVRVIDGNISGGTVYSVYKIIPGILSANHNVNLTDDITIILNYEALIAANPAAAGSPDLRLYFDGVVNHSDPPGTLPVLAGLNLFDPSPVFTNAADDIVPEYPGGTLTMMSPTDEFVFIGAVTDTFRYFNLRPTETSIPFGPNLTGPQYDAVFSVRLGKNIIADLREPIMHSYDPNFLQVDSICKSGSAYMVYYHLEFENEGTDAVNGGLIAKVFFPDYFDLDCFDTISWFAGGEECSGDYKINGNEVTFTFDPDAQLDPMCEPDDNDCSGYVNFYVKVDPGVAVQDIATSLKLMDPQVYFEPQWFKLNSFKDLVKGGNLPERPIKEICFHCRQCPFFICNPYLLAALALGAGGFGLLIWRRTRT